LGGISQPPKEGKNLLEGGPPFKFEENTVWEEDLYKTLPFKPLFWALEKNVKGEK